MNRKAPGDQKHSALTGNLNLSIYSHAIKQTNKQNSHLISGLSQIFLVEPKTDNRSYKLAFSNRKIYEAKLSKSAMYSPWWKDCFYFRNLAVSVGITWQQLPHLSGCFLFSMALSTVAWNCHFTWLTAKSQAIKELVVVLIVLTRGEVWGEISCFTLFALHLWIWCSDL